MRLIPQLARLVGVWSLVLATLVGAAAQGEETYVTGGPLAGVRLPRYPTVLGEEPGYPGCVPELARAAAGDRAPGPDGKFTPQGNQPVLELRPGSPEIYMAYMDKYTPTRSFFDRASLMQLWEAQELAKQTEQYAAPLYWVSRHGSGEPTGKHWPAQPIARLAVDGSPFKLTTRTLPIGLYCVKVVAAVPTEQLQTMRLPIIVKLTVDDGPNGQPSTYHFRTGYVDEFYSVAEIYFHANEPRAYHLEMSLAADSRLPLLVNCVELHDTLANIEVKSYKTRATLCTPEERALLRAAHTDAKVAADNDQLKLIHNELELTPEQRWERDAVLWNGWLPLNAQPGGAYGPARGYAPEVALGVNGQDAQAIQEQYGGWNVPYMTYQNVAAPNWDVLVVNGKLKLSYTVADYLAGKPLPDPYPFKDTGPGIFTPAQGEQPAQHYAPIAEGFMGRGANYTSLLLRTLTPSYHYAGNQTAGRDAAIMLVRLAYDFPALDSANALSALVRVPGGWNRDLHCRQRATDWYNWPWYTQYHDFSVAYDQLYDLIAGNEDLAKSIQRYIPWIKSSQDVLALLDAYLLRTTAKRILRYNWITGEMKIAMLATIQDDRTLTDPWMHWLFTQTWVYPLPPSGIADLMVTACGRNGPEYIASTYYAMGENALSKAMELEPYLRAGGNPQYSLSDAARFPKPVMMCYWPLDISVTGRYALRIGDVAGPDKGYGYRLDDTNEHFRQGWKWTRDPQFAWMVQHELGRSNETDEQWKAITDAAATVQRAPYLTNPSRALAQWASILETGRQHDDYRFRRAVYVRTGMGWGHHHNDSLDLQVQAHGLPMTVDGGQRPGYSKPGDRSTRMHNLVEIDGLTGADGQWLSHSWTKTLADTTGSQYMQLEASAPTNQPNVKFHRRQVALIDVDEGQGSQPLKPEQLKTGVKLPTGITTANSYVVDIVRVNGGKRHTYCFHGAISDEVTTNATGVAAFEQAGAKDQTYLSRFAGERSAGDAPADLTATFRMSIERQGNAFGEKAMLGANFDPDAGRKFTRLHLLGVEGQRVLRGALNCVKWEYQIPMVYVQKRGPREDATEGPFDLQSVYAAVIEPYVGEPIITDLKRQAVTPSDDSALAPVALQVTTRNGHQDFIFADGQAGTLRTIGSTQVNGEYAYVSRDQQGLRQATLVGGTQLVADGLTIKLAVAQRVGQVHEVNYRTKTMTLEGVWPMFAANRTFEIGTADHWTTYTATAAQARKSGSQVTVRGGADFYLSRVVGVDAEKRIVSCALSLAQEEGRPAPGIDKHWVASDENATRFWRADYLGGDRSLGRFDFQLDKAVSPEDFGENGALRLWEYGVGDTVRQNTIVNLRRLDDGSYELTADADVTLTLNGKQHQITLDQLRQTGGVVVLK